MTAEEQGSGLTNSGEASSRGLTRADFRPLATNGFGDPHNSYPHSLTCFRDRLYVSTTRDNLVLVKLRYPFEVPVAAWPVRVPENLWDLDLRPQIWRYEPTNESWTKVYTSPLVRNPEGREVPMTIAFRSMTVFKGLSDPESAIYVPTIAPRQLRSGSVLMRSFDGERFEPLPEIGANLGLGTFAAFRALLPFEGRLFTAPLMAAVPGPANVAGVALVLVSSDPGQGTWEVANEPNFGDPNNISIFEMGAANGFLYVGTVNLAEGFQLWKTRVEGRPPYRWTRVLSRGAFRGRLNQGTAAMAAFGEHLYVSAGIQYGGYDRTNNVGPAAAELIRIAPDDSWDLIAGDPRDTPDGMKLPLSGYGAGFGNPFAGYFWRMCEHEGWLYVGTFDSSVFLSWHPRTNVPEYLRSIFDEGAIENFLQWFSGFDLWRSRDGVRWTPVSTNGLGNRFNYGARTMASTPYGLFLGATNPFGPEIAVRRSGGWGYEPNPAGGAEIWLGSTTRGDDRGRSRPPELQLRDTIRGNGTRKHDAFVCEALVRGYYGNTGYRHCGFWRGRIADAREACANLVEELLSFLPEKRGTIVDVGCGRGATTAHLLRHYPAEAVTGISGEKHGFRACCRVAPAVRFLLGVPELPLSDASVDTVMCVEGIASLRAKGLALREMLRVLRPGGHLVLADILFGEHAGGGGGCGLPGLTTPEAYRELLEHAGFVNMQVVDATHECWTRYHQHRTIYFGLKTISRQIDVQLLDPLRDRLPAGRGGVSAYVLVAAQRPPAHDHRTPTRWTGRARAALHRLRRMVFHRPAGSAPPSL